MFADLQLLLTRGAEVQENRVGLGSHSLKAVVELIAQLANPPDCFDVVFLQQLFGKLGEQLQIVSEDGLHFVYGISHPQKVKEDRHGHQGEEDSKDTVAGDRERSLDGELLQVNQAKREGNLHAKIREPCRRSRNPRGDRDYYRKQQSKPGDAVDVREHKDLRSHAKDDPADERARQPENLFLPGGADG